MENLKPLSHSRYACELFVRIYRPKLVQLTILLQVGATSVSVLRSVWQTYWLHENWDSSVNVFHQLAQSILQMEDRFEDFIQQLNRAGWDTLQMNLKVPKEITFDESGPVWLFKYWWSKCLRCWGWSWAPLCPCNVGSYSLSQNRHASHCWLR